MSALLQSDVCAVCIRMVQYLFEVRGNCPFLMPKSQQNFLVEANGIYFQLLNPLSHYSLEPTDSFVEIRSSFSIFHGDPCECYPAGSSRATTKLRVSEGNREGRGRIFTTLARMDSGDDPFCQCGKITKQGG